MRTGKTKKKPYKRQHQRAKPNYDGKIYIQIKTKTKINVCVQVSRILTGAHIVECFHCQ